MMLFEVPIIATVIGEGGSGGALGIGVSDRILMLENAWYSVISPEGCAAILFRDAAKAPEAAGALKLTAQDLLNFRIADEIIAEPCGGAHRDPSVAANSIKESLSRHLNDICGMETGKMLDLRYEKYRRMGTWTDKTSNPILK